MKIAIVVTVPETLFYLLENQIPYIKARGHTVILFSSRSTYLSLKNVEEKYDVKGYSLLFTRKALTPFHDTFSFFQLLYYFLRKRPDVVHASTPKAGFLAMLAATIIGIPKRIYTIRGIFYCNTYSIKYRVFSSIEKIIASCAHLVITVSPSNKAYLLDKKIVSHTNLIMLNKGSSQGVNFRSRFDRSLVSYELTDVLKKKYECQYAHVVFGFIGRLVPDKGLDDLMLAWPKVWPHISNSKLLLIGPQEKKRKNIFRHYNQFLLKDPTVIVTGHIVDIVPLYTIIDVLLLPSKREGFPNVVLEASAMKLPTITTDALGCADSVVHGITGYIYHQGDQCALAHAMIQLANNPAQRKIMGENARRRVEQDFDPDTITHELIQLYEN